MIDHRPDRQPWDRLESESSKAYAAFLAFRDIGPGRSLSEAYRVHSNRPDARKPSGTFTTWCKRFNWPERADAWDRQLALAHAAGAESAANQAGADWEARRYQAAERAYAAGMDLLEKATALARFPVSMTTEDGGKTTIKPVGAADLRAAAAAAMQGYELATAAIQSALPDDETMPLDEDGKPFDPSECADLLKLKAFVESGGRRIR
jgi:hypothetical protein